MKKRLPANIVIERYSKKYLDGIASLRDYYRKDARVKGVQIYSWKFQANPIGEPEIFIARDGSQIVAMAAATPKKLKIKNGVLTVYELSDGYTHPEYLGMGLYCRLVSLLKERLGEKGIDFTYGVSNDIVYPILKKLGCFEILQLVNFYRPIRTDKLVESMFNSKLLGSICCNIYDPLLRLFDSKILKFYSRNICVERVDRFSPAINQFTQEANNQFDVLLERNQDYLNWRYVNTPQQYKLYLVKYNDKISGYFILRIIEHDKILKGTIVDLISYKDTKLVLAILRSIFLIFSSSKIDVATALTNRGSYYYNFYKYFFLPLRKNIFFISFFTDKSKYLADLSWYFTIGDCDNI